MSTLYRLKAYFGMVPPEDMDAYAEAYGYDDADYDRGELETADRAPYQNPYRADGRRDDVARDGGYPDERGSRYPAEPVPDPRPARSVGLPGERHDGRQVTESAPVGTASRASHRSPTPVHGALAMDAASAAMPAPSPVLQPLPVPSPATSSGSAAGLPLSRITTVHPRSYNEARTIGERYRDGIPVIINLTELDDAAAKRLVDFAAGLAFALRGSIDKVTSRVFLLSPAGVDVSAEERRKLAERGFFGQD